jgi:hypothetical protein
VCHFFPKGESPLPASWNSRLASCKVVSCEARTEGNRTAKFCTDEQEVHMRQISEGKQAHLCEAQVQRNLIFVDVPGIE